MIETYKLVSDEHDAKVATTLTKTGIHVTRGKESLKLILII